MKNIVILVCSDSEWKVVIETLAQQNTEQSKIYGDWFINEKLSNEKWQVIWFHGGWGKIASSGSTQYAIDKWHPELIINIGTCGGFKGFVDLYETILVDETIVYDLIDRIGESGKSIQYYRMTIPLEWLKNEELNRLKKAKMATADQDLDPKQLKELNTKYGVIVGDWESGGIAWVAYRNETKLLILRGVSDVVGEKGNPAYIVDERIFLEGVRIVMTELIKIVNRFIRSIDLAK